MIRNIRDEYNEYKLVWEGVPVCLAPLLADGIVWLLKQIWEVEVTVKIIGRVISTSAVCACFNSIEKVRFSLVSHTSSGGVWQFPCTVTYLTERSMRGSSMNRSKLHPISNFPLDTT